MKNESVLKRVRRSTSGLVICTLAAFSCTDHERPEVPAEPISHTTEVKLSWEKVAVRYLVKIGIATREINVKQVAAL